MYIATTILHISSTEVRPKAKLNQNQTSQQNLLPKKESKSQVKPNKQTKTQRPGAKSQVGMHVGDVSCKMQQIGCKSKLLAPNCSKYQGKLPQTEKQKHPTKQKQKDSPKKLPSIEKSSQKIKTRKQKCKKTPSTWDPL